MTLDSFWRRENYKPEREIGHQTENAPHSPDSRDATWRRPMIPGDSWNVIRFVLIVVKDCGEFTYQSAKNHQNSNFPDKRIETKDHGNYATLLRSWKAFRTKLLVTTEPSSLTKRKPPGPPSPVRAGLSPRKFNIQERVMGSLHPSIPHVNPTVETQSHNSVKPRGGGYNLSRRLGLKGRYTGLKKKLREDFQRFSRSYPHRVLVGPTDSGLWAEKPTRASETPLSIIDWVNLGADCSFRRSRGLGRCSGDIPPLFGCLGSGDVIGPAS